MPAAQTVPAGADVIDLGAAGRHRRRERRWPALVVGVVVFALAYDDGGYHLAARSIFAICLWSAIILALGLGLLSRVSGSRAVDAIAILLGAFALWTLLSMVWAPSRESAFVEFDRSSLYFAVFLVTAGTGRGKAVHWWLDGLRAGILAVTLVALGSRLFPGLFPSRDIGTVLPNAATRLSFPVGYWNALAVLVALSLPLAFAATMSARTSLRRGLALAPVPLIAAVVVLASSRGGVLAALIGTIVFVAAADRRWRALAVVGVGAIGATLAVVALQTHPTLVDGPLGGSVAKRQGLVVAALLLAIVVFTAVLLPLADRLWGERGTPPRSLGRAVVVGAALVVIGAVVLAHPIRRFDEFRRIPASGQTAPNFATSHLTSGSSSGRWQFWSAAVDEWQSAPLIGEGAGSYRFWWSEHATFPYTLRNAHSLYLEVLGELGVVGLLLVLAVFGVGIAASVRGLRNPRHGERQDRAAVAALLVAVAICVGIDWLWQVTVVGAVAVVALALAASSVDAPSEPHASRGRRRPRLALGAVALIGAWVLICAQAVPLLSATRISDSRAAVRRGDFVGALRDARDARAIEPWAAAPYVQMALVAEAGGDLEDAVRWIRVATDRNARDWATWYIAARIEGSAGHRKASHAAYMTAKALNIRSPLFAGPP